MQSVNFCKDNQRSAPKNLGEMVRVRRVYSGLQTTTNQLQTKVNGCSDKNITKGCKHSNKNNTITIWETCISHTIRHRPLMPKRTHHIARLLPPPQKKSTLTTNPLPKLRPYNINSKIPDT